METKILIAGLVGGLLPDIVRIVKERDTGEVPVYLKKWFFYVGLVLQVVLGGVAVYLVAAASIQQAILVGYAAPNIITSLVTKNEKQILDGNKPVPKTIDLERPSRLSLRTWWRK